MENEALLLFKTLGTGLALGLILVVVVLILRWRRGEVLFQKRAPDPAPAWTWPLGTGVFGVLAAGSFWMGMPLFGSLYALACGVYVIGGVRRVFKRQ